MFVYETFTCSFVREALWRVKIKFFILDTDVDVETEYKGKSLQL